MIIGVVASGAFEEKRTGVEEYTFQLINHLMVLPESKKHQFFLYSRKDGGLKNLPQNFIIKQYLNKL